MDFMQIAPARDMLNLYYNDYDWAHGANIHDDGKFSLYAEGADLFDTVFRSGGPLRVWPQRVNRLTLMVEEGTNFVKTRQFVVSAYHFPRRRSI